MYGRTSCSSFSSSQTQHHSLAGPAGAAANDGALATALRTHGGQAVRHVEVRFLPPRLAFHDNDKGMLIISRSVASGDTRQFGDRQCTTLE